MLIGKAGAEMVATWLVQFKDPAKPTTIIATPWSGEDEKTMAFNVMRMMIRAEAENYSFMSECWMATEHKGAELNIRPSEREDKREVVMINACDRKEGKMRMLNMIRGVDGRVTDLVRDPDQPDRYEGRAANFLLDA